MALNDATGLETLDGEELPKIDPTQNPRNQRMMEIAKEEGQHKADGVEFVDIDTADYESKPQPKEESPKVETKEEEPASKKFKLDDEEITEEELLRRAREATGAQRKFEEAARLRKEAEELRQQANQPKLESVPTIDDDDRALARALQMGSEEEAAQVVKRLRNSQSGIQPGQIAGVVEMVSAGNWAKQTYPEIFSSPRLLKLFLEEDAELVGRRDGRPYQDRYRHIGDSMLKEFNLRKPEAAQDKLDKKASLQVVPRASVKNAPPQSEDDEEQTASQIIAQEAKRRGQLFVR